MKVFLKTEDEIELMRQANQLVGKTLGELARHIKPGVTTLQLDKIADEFIRDHGAIPTFKGFPNPYGGPFPASICTSVNDVVVHGVPRADTVLREGDIISIDCGTRLNGFCGDSCYTFCVGEVADDVKLLLRTTKEALYKGIENAVAGHHLGDISAAVQDHCEAQGYGLVRELTGHGIGREMHEDPQVPNYGRRGNGILLKARILFFRLLIFAVCGKEHHRSRDDTGKCYYGYKYLYLIAHVSSLFSKSRPGIHPVGMLTLNC